MGLDATVSGKSGTREERSRKGEVVELLPSAGVRVRLESEEVVIAHAAGSAVKNFVRLRPGDRVRVELSRRDKTRARIVELLWKG